MQPVEIVQHQVDAYNTRHTKGKGDRKANKEKKQEYANHY